MMPLDDKASIDSNIHSQNQDKRRARNTNRNVSSYTDDGYVTKTNQSNRNIIHKSSIKQKLFSFFKNHSKMNSKISVSNVEKKPGSNTWAAITRPELTTVMREKGPLISESEGCLDRRDRQLVDKIRLHSLTRSIIAGVTEQPCSPIKLPRAWLATVGGHLSNRALQPFLPIIPGLMGLSNHGNTCYVNVVIQCLAHLDSLAQYLSTKDYLEDIRQSPHNDDRTVSKSDTSGLDVVVALSYLLQSLWQHTYHANVSVKFCQLLALHQTQFSLDSQQDAHELLLCVLNLLHDNLSRQGSDSTEGTSFIYDRFRGWLSNEIMCPQCGYNRTFSDQILSLNLQIPEGGDSWSHNNVFCIVVTTAIQISEKHAFEVDKSTTVAHIRHGVGERLGSDACDIIVLELIDSGFGNMFRDDELIFNVAHKTNYLSWMSQDNLENGLYAIHIENQVVDVDSLITYAGSTEEVPSFEKRRKDLWDSQPFIRLLIVHVEKIKDHIANGYDDYRWTLDTNVDGEPSFRRFTNVLTVQASRKTTLELLRQSLGEQMCKCLNLKIIAKLPRPQLYIGGSQLSSPTDTYPLLHSAVASALRESALLCGEESAFVKLVVAWPFNTTRILKFNRRAGRHNVHNDMSLSLNNQRILLHRSVEELSAKYSADSRYKSVVKITINDCLREYFSIDSVSVTEPWNCPSCQTVQKAHTNIRIKQAPEILILMLKRFINGNNLSRFSTRGRSGHKERQESRMYQSGVVRKDTLWKKSSTNMIDGYLNKLECFIDYPLENLDMAAYAENVDDVENYLYNLVAVVNHRGNLSIGHYVAICQNSIDGQWRLYDDEKVTEITKFDVVNRDAYMLFYKRKSTSADLNAELNLHWSYRRLSFPDKIHRNQSPNPTSLYTKHRRYSERDTLKSRDSNVNVPLTVSNNQNSCEQLTSESATCITEAQILSPYLSLSSSIGSLATHETISETLSPSSFRCDREVCNDITTITSGIESLEDIRSVYHLESGVSILSDSVSYRSLVKPSRVKRGLRKESKSTRADQDECYYSMSTSPSASSPPIASSKLHRKVSRNIASNKPKVSFRLKS